MPVDLRAELQGIKKAIDKGRDCHFCIGVYRDGEHKQSCPVERLSALLAEAEAPRTGEQDALWHLEQFRSNGWLVSLEGYPDDSPDDDGPEFRWACDLIQEAAPRATARTNGATPSEAISSALALLDRGQITPAPSGGEQELVRQFNEWAPMPGNFAGKVTSREVRPSDWGCPKGCGWSEDAHEQCGGACPVDERPNEP